MCFPDEFLRGPAPWRTAFLGTLVVGLLLLLALLATLALRLSRRQRRALGTRGGRAGGRAAGGWGGPGPRYRRAGRRGTHPGPCPRPLLSFPLSEELKEQAEKDRGERERLLPRALGTRRSQTGGSEQRRDAAGFALPTTSPRSREPASSPAWSPERGDRVCALWGSEASAFVHRDFLFSSFLLQGNSPQSWVCSGCPAHLMHPIRRLWTAIDGKDLILNPSLSAARVFSLRRP